MRRAIEASVDSGHHARVRRRARDVGPRRVLAALAVVLLGVISLVLSASPAWATAGTITTVAGTGTPGFSGDGGPAAAAQLSFPAGVAVDSSGSYFIADLGNHRVRKVDPSGVITTVAGTGTAGFSGDGGPATAAELDSPSDVVLDSAGDLFIVDFGDNRVRKIDTSGTITTVAGTGAAGSSGDGGSAASAKLDAPAGLDIDSAGNLFIADYGNNRVRKVSASGTITTVAGTGAAGFSGDGGPATSAKLDAPGDVVVWAGNLFIADSSNSSIRRVDPSGVISTVAGTGVTGFSGDSGPATSAQLSFPVGLAVDSSGNLFIADYGNNRIREVDLSGTITTVAGTGAAGSSGDGGAAVDADLYAPARVNLDAAGDFFISDLANSRIREVEALGSPATVPDAPTGGERGGG